MVQENTNPGQGEEAERLIAEAIVYDAIKNRPAMPHDLILPKWFDDRASLAISLANKDSVILILAHPEHQPCIFNFEQRQWDDSCLVTLNDGLSEKPSNDFGAIAHEMSEKIRKYLHANYPLSDQEHTLIQSYILEAICKAMQR